MTYRTVRLFRGGGGSHRSCSAPGDTLSHPREIRSGRRRAFADMLSAPHSPPPPRPAGRIDWGQVRLLYARELRGALRERNIVVNSVLLPILLYPLILWGVFSAIMFVQGQTESFASRI